MAVRVTAARRAPFQIRPKLRRAGQIVNHLHRQLIGFDRFEALFAGELDELQAYADEYDVALQDVAVAYFLIARGDRPMLRRTELSDRMHVSTNYAQRCAKVLKEHGEVHRSYGATQDSDSRYHWWVCCSERLAKTCKQRSISLQRYVDMRKDLIPFQDEVVRWYHTRQMKGNLQRKTMKEIKRDHGERLQQQYFPDDPIDGNLHDHYVSLFLKTAQDEIVEAMNLNY